MTYAFTSDQLSELAARSLHLYERATQNGRQPTLISDEKLAAASVTWGQVCAHGDSALFEKRLEQDGLSLKQWHAACSPAAWPDSQPVPGWCGFLNKSLSQLGRFDEAEMFLTLPDQHRYPFHSLIKPFVRTSVERLQKQLTASQEQYLPALLAGSENYLARSLCHQASMALHLEFTLFLNRHESPLERIMRRARNENSDEYYRAFTRHFYQGRWVVFLQEYPVLARQLSECCLQWVSAANEVLGRWVNDKERIGDFFAGLANEDPVSFAMGQSDRHNAGRSTVFVEFPSGKWLVYKPKPLHTDALMTDLLKWISGAPGSLPLKHAKTLNCERYGWQEWVSHKACHDTQQAADFYQRTGYLLALIYALEGYDYHHENIIACGDTPVLIDTETIFNPYKEMERVVNDEADASTLAAQTVFYSVIRTGLLPVWTVRDNGTRQDLSGLGGGGLESNDPHYLKRWVDANTDDMRLEEVQEPVRPRGNQPFLSDGSELNAEDYVGELRRGFGHVYQLLLNQRGEFLACLQRHSRIPVRFVRRATRVYSDQLYRLVNPDCLRDGMVWSREMEYQSRMFLAADSDNQQVWRMLRREYQMLMEMDIPYFKVRADGLHIADGEGQVVVEDYFSRHCLDRLNEKLDLLNPRDLAIQDRYIAYSFYARVAQSIHAVDPEMGQASLIKDSTDQLPPVERDRCIAHARQIADELIDEALTGPDGSISWVALEYLKEADVFQLKPISYNLYSGSMGVAVLLSAMGYVTGEQRYSKAGDAALKPLTRIMREEPQQVVRLSGMGGGLGLGSLIYGLLCVAQWREPDKATELVELASQCAVCVDEELITADRKFDLMYGTAGGLLALCKLMEMKPSDELQNQLRVMANHLMANLSGDDSLVPTYDGRAVTGFSHGSAGIALGLARAALWTEDSHYSDAAMRHVAFEESLFDQQQGNYPDYRSKPDRPAFMTTWCHGTPGIGLSRLKHYQINGDQELLAVARRNMDATGRFTLAHLDHTCCGNLGRLDIQWEYACQQHDEIYQQSLRRDLTAVLDQCEKLGGFRLFLNAPTQVFSPGLFTGAAGIAYTLLRFAEPGKLPCLLAFD